MAPADSRSDLARQRRCGDEDVDEEDPYTFRHVLEALASLNEIHKGILARLSMGSQAAADHDTMDSDSVASAVQAAEFAGIDDTSGMDDIAMVRACLLAITVYAIRETCDVAISPVPCLFESICMVTVKKQAAPPMPLWEVIVVSRIVNGISGGLVLNLGMGMWLGRQAGLFAESMHARPFSAPESTLSAW